ncbi:hypothetical protein [Bacillus mycoides]|nr:hypothetical protein [Bacillus mycoides]EOO40895.1 hypothetical protein IKK_01096 [Bacillus mycoides]QWH97674.1 hypothetical protein EXW36_06450 [Bacillus mycoides]
MNGISAYKLLKTAEMREDKLRMILEKAENGDPKAIKVLEEINRMLKQV